MPPPAAAPDLRTGAAAAGGGLHRRIGYLPQLDGVRAVAVLAVMAYHAEVSWLAGGFLGVDVFFALSGYLITTLLLVERDQDGSISLVGFWGRRARRLLPALYAVLVFTALFGVLWASEVQLARLRGDALAALLYVANWRLIFSEQSYFDIFDPSPLRHMWSLAIEEQWYLLWPVLAGAGFRRFGSRTAAMAALVLAAGLCSAALMAVLAGDGDPSRSYYGTDTRAQTLLLGTAAALWLHRRQVSVAMARAVQAAGVAGTWVLVACFAMVHDGDQWMYRGGFLLVAVAAVAVITSAVLPGASFTRPLLQVAPLAWIGRISYGLYLWHWPLYVLIDEERTGLSGPALVGTRFAVTFVVALISYHHLEMPIRRGALPGRAGLVSALAAAALVAGTILVATVGAEEPEVALEVGGGVGDLRVMVVGDSVGYGLASFFPADAHPDVAVRNAAVYACGLFDAEAQIGGAPGERRMYSRDRCVSLRHQVWDEDVAQFDPEVTVMELGVYEGFDYEVDGEVLAFGSDAWRRYAVEELGRRVDELTSGGGRVAVLTPHCFRGRAAEKNTTLAALAHDLVDEHPDETFLVDLMAFLCPDGSYQAEHDGTRLYKDGRHYGRAGAELVWSWLVPQLEAELREAG